MPKITENNELYEPDNNLITKCDTKAEAFKRAYARGYTHVSINGKKRKIPEQYRITSIWNVGRY